MLEIFYSVVGGFIVLAVMWILKIPIPFLLQRIVYQEPTISGEWTTVFHENDQTFHENVTLKQRGRRVTGKIVLRLSESENPVYEFEGTFKHLIMTCTYRSTDPSEYERGAFALRYTKKKKFIGQHVLISKESEKLISSDYEWSQK